MKIALLLIGNELLNGKIRDENLFNLTKILRKYHLNLDKVEFIKDDEASFASFMRSTWGNYDCLITSGGLGPTEDDLTKKMLSKFFNAPLEKSDSALELIHRQYQEKGKTYPSHFSYEYIPKGFVVFYNKSGFAPGLLFKESEKTIISLPGVPSEFSEMIDAFFSTHSEKFSKDKLITEHFTIRTYKVPEAKIFGELAPTLWQDLAKFGKVSSLPKLYGVDIGVEMTGESYDSIEQDILKIKNLTSLKNLDPFIWQLDDIPIENWLVDQASKKGLTFSFAESCTGGLCSHRITNVSGSSSAFYGGVVSYSNELKMSFLDVKAATLKAYGAVSVETAKEMASGCQQHTNSDIAISLTGIAGPYGGSDEKPVGTVAIGLASRGESVSAKLYHFHGDREKLKHKFSEVALFTLLEKISSY